MLPTGATTAGVFASATGAKIGLRRLVRPPSRFWLATGTKAPQMLTAVMALAGVETTAGTMGATTGLRNLVRPPSWGIGAGSPSTKARIKLVESTCR